MIDILIFLALFFGEITSENTPKPDTEQTQTIENNPDTLKIGDTDWDNGGM